ncbi:hypothetical protein [Streptomyces zinciresistens]|nr:hypothetical protein [Streptomyces zinciresistens]
MPGMSTAQPPGGRLRRRPRPGRRSSCSAGAPLVTAFAFTLVVGAGVDALVQSTMVATTNNADPREMGAVTGTAARVRTIGGSLGGAQFGALRSSRMTDVLTERLGPAAQQRLTAGGVLTPAGLTDMSTATRDAVREVVSSGLRGVPLGAVVLSAIAVGHGAVAGACPCCADCRCFPRAGRGGPGRRWSCHARGWR